MRQIFADTFYWIALINPEDDWHKQVLTVSYSLSDTLVEQTHQSFTLD